jgi:hypothetical protein
MFTTAQIDGMTGDTLQRAIAKILDAGLVDQQDTNEKYEQSIGTAQAADNRLGLALERVAAALEARNGRTLNKAQDAYLRIFEVCMSIRKQSMSTTTSDGVQDDVVLDAVRMAGVAFTALKPKLIEQEVPPGGLDWN